MLMGLHLSFEALISAMFTSASFEQEGKVEFSIHSVMFS